MIYSQFQYIYHTTTWPNLSCISASWRCTARRTCSRRILEIPNSAPNRGEESSQAETGLALHVPSMSSLAKVKTCFQAMFWQSSLVLHPWDCIRLASASDHSRTFAGMPLYRLVRPRLGRRHHPGSNVRSWSSQSMTRAYHFGVPFFNVFWVCKQHLQLMYLFEWYTVLTYWYHITRHVIVIMIIISH